MSAATTDILGIGLAFPIRPNERGSLPLAHGEERVRQSIWIILSTAKGERQMLDRFGCGIHDLVFEANTASLRGRVQEEVREALVLFEPRVDVVDVRVETQPGARNRLEIIIDYRVRSNNSFHNLVYPLYLNEGSGQGI